MNAYIATFQLIDLSVALSTLLGGWLYDHHPRSFFTLDFTTLPFSAVDRGLGFVVLFVNGFKLGSSPDRWPSQQGQHAARAVITANEIAVQGPSERRTSFHPGAVAHPPVPNSRRNPTAESRKPCRPQQTRRNHHSHSSFCIPHYPSSFSTSHPADTPTLVGLGKTFCRPGPSVRRPTFRAMLLSRSFGHWAGVLKWQTVCRL